MTSCTGSARAEDFVDFEKISYNSRVETCLGRRRLTFACSRRPWAGVARDSDEKARTERMCISLLMLKNL